MRIALTTYQAAFQNPGGGEVVLLKHLEHLTRLGHQVKLFNQWSSQLKDFDLVHNFGAINRDFWFAVKAAGVPLLVTPILWPEQTIVNRLIAPFARFFRSDSPYPTKNPFRIFHEFGLPDLYLTNSASEANRVRSVFRVAPNRIKVIPNGVDQHFREADRSLFIKRYRTENFLLCVGRIARVKNQLGLIRATAKLGLKLVFIGSPQPADEDYYKQCRAEAAPETLFIDRLEQGSALLASAYAAAQLVVVPSYFETCGLVAMEAGLAGAPVAITSQGGTRDYYQDYVSYLAPQSIDSLRASLLTALARPPRTAEFRAYIETNYLWELIIERTVAVYEEVMSLRTNLASQPTGVNPSITADDSSLLGESAAAELRTKPMPFNLLEQAPATRIKS